MQRAAAGGLTALHALLLIGLAVAAIATFLPWYKGGDDGDTFNVTAWKKYSFLWVTEQASKNVDNSLGRDPLDALIIVALAGTAALVTITRGLRTNPRTRVYVFVASGLILALGIANFIDLNDNETISLSAGVFMVLASGAAATIAALLLLRQPAETA